MNTTMFLYQVTLGACGGIVLFLYGCKQGYYKNNKYKIKFSIDVIGAVITSAMVSQLIKEWEPNILIVTRFIFGFSWTVVLQLLRKKSTTLIAAVIGEKIEE